jgi:hypothetical protein
MDMAGSAKAAAYSIAASRGRSEEGVGIAGVRPLHERIGKISG